MSTMSTGQLLKKYYLRLDSQSFQSFQGQVDKISLDTLFDFCILHIFAIKYLNMLTISKQALGSITSEYHMLVNVH